MPLLHRLQSHLEHNQGKTTILSLATSTYLSILPEGHPLFDVEGKKNYHNRILPSPS